MQSGHTKPSGELISFVFIAADRAAPHGLALDDRLWRGFDVLSVIVVSAGRRVVQHERVRRLGDEQRMRGELLHVRHAALEHGIDEGYVRVEHVILSASGIPETFELVCILAGSEPEPLEHVERHVLVEDGNVELPRPRYHAVRVVRMIDGDDQPQRIARHLHHGIDYATVILTAFAGGQYVQAVAYAI